MGRQARKERRKARWDRRGEQEEGGGEERQPEDTMDGERYPAAIDVHPTKPVAVVGLGKAAFLVDLEQSRTTRIVQVDTSDHQDQGIRSVRFNPGGTAIAVAGDDKHLRMWDENLERCLVEVKLAKKISAVVFAEDGRKLLVSDRFGDVYSVECGDMQMACAPQPFLGHFGSAIQDIQLSPCGRFVVTCDADGKIRVSRMPKDLLKGAHEIESFCLGHTGTVLKTAFVGGAACSHLLLSSGNDDTLRLWDIRTGVQIHQLDLNLSEAGWKGSDADFPNADSNAAKDDHVVSTCNGHPEEGENGLPQFFLKKSAFLIADKTKQMFAVAQEVSAAIFLLSVDVQSQRIVLQQRLLCPENHIPLCGAYNMSGDLLLLGRAREGQSAFFMLAQRRPGAHSLHFNEAWKLDSDGEVTHGET